jgi:hypothetical protein
MNDPYYGAVTGQLLVSTTKLAFIAVWPRRFPQGIAVTHLAPIDKRIFNPLSARL